MVAVNPAKSIGWDDKVGSISQGHFADIVVFDRIDNNNNNNDDDDDHADPYLNLIKSAEGNLKLSTIGGRPRYRDPEILDALGFQNFPKN
jgi:cytosine/adenosine deaminase-related metal-dependent hydrolase